MTSPEVIRFHGMWSGLYGMHKHFFGQEKTLSFESVENGLLRRVVWTHEPEISSDYFFVAMHPSAVISEGYRLYNLDIDESEAIARLYVVRVLGETATRGDEGIENDWHEFQKENGLVLPNIDDKANFQRIFKDFCTATVVHSEMN